MRSLYAGPADPARDRRAGRQGRQGRRRTRPRQAKSVQRRLQERQPRARGQGASSRRAEGLRQRPRGLPDGTPVTADFVMGSYPRLFEIEKSFRMSNAGPAGLPQQARLHRGPPDRSVRRTRRQPVDRATDRLVNQEIRKDRTPLPHSRDPGRPAPHSLRRPIPRRPPPSPSKPSTTPAKVCTNCPKSGHHLDPALLALRRKPLSEFTTEDLRLMPGQNPDARDRKGLRPGGRSPHGR